jgi:hypothetical protein
VNKLIALFDHVADYFKKRPKHQVIMLKKMTGKISHKIIGIMITKAKILEMTTPIKGRSTNKTIEMPIATADNANKNITTIAIGFSILR